MTYERRDLRGSTEAPGQWNEEAGSFTVCTASHRHQIIESLNVRADQKEEVFKLFEGSPVCCRVLYEFRGRLSILLYRPGMLRAYLEREDVKRLMASFGYEDLGLEETLDRIAEGYQEHMDGKLGFPHEIGLVLGYPPVDVEGFIKKGGRDFLYSGYWKVYGNLEDALKTFEAYDRARDYVISMTGNGNEIRDILAAS